MVIIDGFKVLSVSAIFSKFGFANEYYLVVRVIRFVQEFLNVMLDESNKIFVQRFRMVNLMQN